MLYCHDFSRSNILLSKRSAVGATWFFLAYYTVSTDKRCNQNFSFTPWNVFANKCLQLLIPGITLCKQFLKSLRNSCTKKSHLLVQRRPKIWYRLSPDVLWYIQWLGTGSFLLTLSIHYYNLSCYKSERLLDFNCWLNTLYFNLYSMWPLASWNYKTT